MVKKLKSEDFLSELAKFYSASRDKNTVYLTMKRMYEEKQKYKNNRGKRKLRKQRIHTIITPDELSRFHKNLTNVLIMHFITEEKKKKEKKIATKKMSKTQKRKIKKLKKINKMQLEK